MAKKNRVCIIVDNPLRDLDGCVLVAWHLANSGVEVYLVPMHFKEEVYKIRPTLILTNYIRTVNRSFTKNCRDIGIITAVMDTEGGFIEDWDKRFGDILKLIHLVDLYCTWGYKQYNTLKEGMESENTTLVATGCPRFDFYIAPWRDTIPDIASFRKQMILVNTKFSRAIPRFQSEEREIKAMLNEGYDMQFTLRNIQESKDALNGFIEALKNLAPKFPEQLFVLRPHPFEKKEFYEDAFKDYPNVEVHQKGTVLPWIKKSVLLLHYNCTTSLEALLVGREPIHFNWIKAPTLWQEVSNRLSILAESVEEMESMVKKILNGEKLETPESKIADRQKVLRDFFHSDDGKSSQRVAGNIIGIINKKSSSSNVGLAPYIVKAIPGYLSNSEWKNSVICALSFLVGSRNYKLLKKVLLGKGKSGKEYETSDVEAILKRVTSAAGLSTSYSVESANNSMTGYRGVGGYYSIRVLKTY